MLPDLPSLKQDLRKILDRYLHDQVNTRLGVFNESPRQFIHEGNRLRVIRANGTIEDSSLQASSAEMTIKYDEIPHLTLQDRIIKLNEMADEMANQISGYLFKSLNDTLEAAGQSISHKGRPLDADALFALLEKIHIDFDETGKHHPLSLIIPPQLMDKAKLVIEQIESDPELQKRHKELMERKRMEWRDREANRKLVG